MSVLLFPPKESALVKVFCFPFAGGNASAYLKWTSQLPEWLDVCMVEMPGHGIRSQEVLVNDIQKLAKQLYQDLASYCDRPYVLFGHSMGALVALELAHYIQQQPDSVVTGYCKSILVSGRPAPSHALLGHNHHLLDDATLLQNLSRFGGIPKELEEYPELVELAMPILRNDVSLIELAEPNQVHLKQLDIPLMAVSGTNEPDFNYEGLVSWRHYTTEWLGAHQISGDHFYFQEPKALEQLCGLIKMHCGNIYSHV